MNRISIGQAWSYATAFFNGHAANHAVVIIGVGIVAPLILQLLMGGTSAAVMDPTAMASGGMMAMGASLILIGLLNYILQTGSYFASWRIGLTDGGEPLGGAIGYGLIAALPVLLLTIAVVIVFGIIGFVLFGSAMAPMLMGGGPPSEAAAAGLGVAILLLLPLFFLFMLWLAARFCVMGPVMADRRSFNVLSGLGQSWRLTAASQWKIFAYFLLLVIALIVIFTVLALVVGVSMFAGMSGGGAPGAGSMIGILVMSFLVGIPIAYLQVAIPAGLYRTLGEGNRADVFA